MNVAEFFGQMESEGHSAIPWPWPRSMTADQLNWFRVIWCESGREFEPIRGVYLSDVIRITGKERGKVITISSSLSYYHAESFDYKIPVQGDCWAVMDGRMVKFR